MLTVFIAGGIAGIMAGYSIGTRTAFARLGKAEHRNRMNAVKGK
jgi:hypothetical protein